MVQGLISNFAILSTFIFILIQFSKKSLIAPSQKEYISNIIIAFLFGMIGIIQMYLSIQVSPTIIIDLRSLAIVCSSVLGGFFPSLITSLVIALGRILLFGEISTAAKLGALSLILTGIGCGIIAKYEAKYYKKWIFSLLYAALLPAITLYILLREKSFDIILPFLTVLLLTGVLIAYLIYYLDKSKSLFLKYETEATQDYLTGLLNIRSFDTNFNNKIKQAGNNKKSLSVLFIDIDFFKKINDTYGHKIGDDILKHFAEIVSDSIRLNDKAFRIGGEEFAVLLEDCPHKLALDIAEKIRRKVNEHEFNLAEITIRITASIGVATFPEVSKEKLLEDVDNALYAAKRSGRNKVVSYTEIAQAR